MLVVSSTVSSPVLEPSSFDDRLARRNAVLLATATALAGANATVIFATAAIVGSVLAPDKGLATLPISIFVVGMAAGTLPVGWIAKKFGRRAAFLTGALAGIITGLLACFAVVHGQFSLLCLATFLGASIRPPRNLIALLQLIQRVPPLNPKRFHGCLRAEFSQV